MKTFLATMLTVLLAFGSASGARADAVVVLVELFTSQGCSSCPPADANLAALADREDVLALSLHVDYWDYLGWRDTFGQKAHTERQVAYRDLMGARVVYTPQIIVHGTQDVAGHRAKAIDAAIAEARTGTETARLAIVTEGGMLKAVIQPADEPERCTLWIAAYDRSRTVRIARGENAGREITYHNVVRELMTVGAWDGSAQKLALPQPASGQGVAVWLQDDRTGRVLTVRFVEE